MARRLKFNRRTGPRVVIVLYGQQRFHQQELGLFRTIRRLSRICREVQISGHLWTGEQKLAAGMGLSLDRQALLSQVEISHPDLIKHDPPPGQDINLVWQATSQRRAIQAAIETTKNDPDLVILTRTDLFIPHVDSLIGSIPKSGEVWKSNFYHEGVDDNIAILAWSSFQKLSDVNFQKALEDPSVIHGEHLREQLFSQSNLRLSQAMLPYVILRRDISPHVDLALASVRMALRRTLPESAYRFATSPKSELVRLTTKAIQKTRPSRFED